jgi:hypothetical protein
MLGRHADAKLSASLNLRKAQAMNHLTAAAFSTDIGCEAGRLASLLDVKPASICNDLRLGPSLMNLSVSAYM